jgi:hypothetical protein
VRRLFLYLVPAVGLLVGYGILLQTDVPRYRVISIASASATGVAWVGCFSAALAFEPGDYLRRAWLANGIGYLSLFASALVRRPDAPEWVTYTRIALTIVSNVSGVIGAILFARTYRAAGLLSPISWAVRLGTLAVTTVLAVLAAGIPVIENARALVDGTGTISAYLGVFSSAGDGIMLVLIAPLVMTAFALSGGRLAQTFWLLSASYAAWLFFDAQDTVDFFLDLSKPEMAQVTLIVEPFRQLACSLVFAAAMAQRDVARG